MVKTSRQTCVRLLSATHAYIHPPSTPHRMACRNVAFFDPSGSIGPPICSSTTIAHRCVVSVSSSVLSQSPFTVLPIAESKAKSAPGSRCSSRDPPPPDHLSSITRALPPDLHRPVAPPPALGCRCCSHDRWTAAPLAPGRRRISASPRASCRHRISAPPFMSRRWISTPPNRA
ncbi:hypothetical protein BS78_05G183000 [Paspalum vaginatum]|nr:hypothetical protein BS78_05G183000 [Paspalum vaginatum]